MSEEFTVKRFEFHDIKNVLPLYKHSFGHSYSFPYLENKFFARYQEIRSSHLTLNKNGDAVSFYGLICQKAVKDGQVFYIGQSCDSMTHPKYSGKGLFVDLAKKCYEDLKQQGIELVYGFPNEAIYGLRVKKLHWTHEENIHMYKDKVFTIPLAKVVKKLPFLKPLYNSYLKSVLSKHLSKRTFFRNSVLQDGVGGVLHDEEYFIYKKGADKFIIEIESALFWIKFDGVMWVGDFENTDEHTFRKALRVLRRIGVLTGSSSILFYFQEKSANDVLLSQVLKEPSLVPLGYRSFSDSINMGYFKFCGADFDTW